MNRTKLWSVVAGVVLALTTVMFLQNPAPVGAVETCMIVKLWDRDKIEPLNVSINQGDCLVWVNFSRPTSTAKVPGDAMIVFPDATKCIINEVKASVGFKMEKATDCFVAGWIRPGETASLVFAKPGTYKYKIKFKFGKDVRDVAGEGTVVVK
ncbi:MAG: hypothetical protein HY892_03265 [Deltaproteobacteria bacterium]|nr:hypothetical protein [Deltaproteobacteria bacterium]